MVREEEDSYRLIFEEPIFPDEARNEDAALRELTKRYVAVMESYIRRYPTQWYIFKNLWENDEKLLRPDTII
jgi:lauroyl/myristoyl acyltransferase